MKESNYTSRATSYTPVIGLEVHVELKTKSKMFCGCSADYFGHKPNTHVCPVCLGLPGALPVPNKTAIEWCVTIGMALNCKIPPFSKFDRKNYFYPDLPKGYQISQYDQPFCVNGSIKLSNGKTIGIRRVHMEEDTAKLLHVAGSALGVDNNLQATSHKPQASLIDFNRSGVPLVEIVTEPDFESTEKVVEYLKKLQQIVRYLDVSNADMEKGEMRLEPNISLARSALHVAAGSKNHEPSATSHLPSYKVEIKNINSFRFVEKAINYEINRQKKILEEGKTPTQETRGWNESKNATISQRTKEEAHDYRYFPEPDIPPIRWTEGQITHLRSQLPELPDKKLERFQKEYGLSAYDAGILTRERGVADFFEESVRVGKEYNVTPKQIANVIINKKIDIEKTLPAELIKQVLQTSQSAQIDEKELEALIETVLKENQKAVSDYKNGKESAIMFLVGQVMRQHKEKIDTGVVKKALLKKLH